MAKRATNENSFHYIMSHQGSNYSVKAFWQPGDPITVQDEKMLARVKLFYQRMGYPPCRADFPDDYVRRLKKRFRIWKNVILAAGLPALNSKEVQKKKQGMQLTQGKKDKHMSYGVPL